MKTVKMPQEMRGKANNLWVQKGMLEIKFQSYIEGCKDGLGLNGDWNLDLGTWTFNPVPKKEGK